MIEFNLIAIEKCFIVKFDHIIMKKHECFIVEFDHSHHQERSNLREYCFVVDMAIPDDLVIQMQANNIIRCQTA